MANPSRCSDSLPSANADITSHPDLRRSSCYLFLFLGYPALVSSPLTFPPRLLCFLLALIDATIHSPWPAFLPHASMDLAAWRDGMIYCSRKRSS